MLLLIVVLLLLLVAFGYLGHPSGAGLGYGVPNILGLILVILVIVFLFHLLGLAF